MVKKAKKKKSPRAGTPPVTGACEFHVDHIPITVTDDELMVQLNALGADGWNLSYVSPTPSQDPVNTVRVIFTRQL